MSKRYNIRWRDSDQQELKRVVKNFNAKIDRLAKKDPEKAFALPDKITVGQMKELITTRNDLNRELNSLRRFSKRGSEELVVLPDNKYKTSITKWQKNEMQMYAGLVTKARKKRLDFIESIEKTSGGKKLGYTTKEFGMGQADKVALSPVGNVFYPSMDRRNAHKRMISLRKQAQDSYYDKADKIYMDNYIQSLRETYNEADIEEIIKKIENTSMPDFIEKLKAEDPDFEFNYAFSQEEYEKNLNQLKSIWTPNRKKGG